jgi:hypothetical protein
MSHYYISLSVLSIRATISITTANLRFLFETSFSSLDFIRSLVRSFVRSFVRAVRTIRHASVMVVSCWLTCRILELTFVWSSNWCVSDASASCKMHFMPSFRVANSNSLHLLLREIFSSSGSKSSLELQQLIGAGCGVKVVPACRSNTMGSLQSCGIANTSSFVFHKPVTAAYLQQL